MSLLKQPGWWLSILRIEATQAERATVLATNSQAER